MPALSKQFKYFWNTSYQGQNTPATPTPPIFDPTTSAKLSIPKIGVEAPILWNIEEKDFNTKLLEGVVHYKGTALPGDVGNVFITGHSSYYAWVDSPYKDTFALLDKLNVGDKIYIQYQNGSFIYEVSNSKVVTPDKMEVLQSTNERVLTLMTCVPVGTNLRRLIVTAKQISANGLF